MSENPFKKIVYHATTEFFACLRTGSWVSTSIDEAARHLLLKNASCKDELLDKGWIITIPVDNEADFTSMIVMGSVENMVTNCPIMIDLKWWTSLRNSFDYLSEITQKMFNASECYDLTHLLT